MLGIMDDAMHRGKDGGKSWNGRCQQQQYDEKPHKTHEGSDLACRSSARRSSAQKNGRVSRTAMGMELLTAARINAGKCGSPLESQCNSGYEPTDGREGAQSKSKGEEDGKRAPHASLMLHECKREAENEGDTRLRYHRCIAALTP